MPGIQAYSQIRPQANDFPALLRMYPQIRCLLFNGAAAFRFYKQAFGEPQTAWQQMPSTSPAYTLPFEQKRAAWREGLELIL